MTKPLLHISHNEEKMLSTIVIVLVVLWALGLIGGYALGGLVHLLLVAAIIVLALRVLSGRRVV